MNIVRTTSRISFSTHFLPVPNRSRMTGHLNYRTTTIAYSAKAREGARNLPCLYPHHDGNKNVFKAKSGRMKDNQSYVATCFIQYPITSVRFTPRHKQLKAAVIYFLLFLLLTIYLAYSTLYHTTIIHVYYGKCLWEAWSGYSEQIYSI